MYSKTVRFPKSVEAGAQEPVVGRPPSGDRPGNDGDAERAPLTIRGRKAHFGHQYSKLMNLLREIPIVTRISVLTAEALLYFSTLRMRKRGISMKQCRALLSLSVERYDLDDVRAIDAPGVDRSQASQHDAKRTDYTLEAAKPTLLLEHETSTILDIHCSMK